MSRNPGDFRLISAPLWERGASGLQYAIRGERDPPGDPIASLSSAALFPVRDSGRQALVHVVPEGVLTGHWNRLH